MTLSTLLAEGGWQTFELGSAEWTVLILSAAAALLAIAVGFYLAKSVMAADQGTPKMQEIAAAIQEGASAYLTRQFKTIGVILIPVAAIVFFTSTEDRRTPRRRRRRSASSSRVWPARSRSSSAASPPASPATSA